MASMFVDVNTCQERLEFSDSSSEDIACAKLFWQTICLAPHLESGLVSSDVSQRRRSAPIPGKKTNSDVNARVTRPKSGDQDYKADDIQNLH